MGEITTAQWWQPSQPDRRLPGVSLDDGERGWLLRLDGSFEELPKVAVVPLRVPLAGPDDYPVLLGLTSQGKFVTLDDPEVYYSFLHFHDDVSAWLEQRNTVTSSTGRA